MKYIKVLVLFLFYILYFYLNKVFLLYLLEKGFLDFLPDFFLKMVDIILYAMLSLIFLFRLRKRKGKLFQFHQINYFFVFLAFVLGILFRLMEDPFINAEYILNAVNVDIDYVAHYRMSYDLVFKIVLIVAMGPFLEELIFRKIMLGYLGRNFITLILSSALFAFIHAFSGFDVSKLISSFLFGIILGLVYYKGGFLYSIWLHVFYNSIVFILNHFFSELYGQFLLKLNFGISYWLIVTLSFILMLVILSKYYLPIITLADREKSK